MSPIPPACRFASSCMDWCNSFLPPQSLLIISSEQCQSTVCVSWTLDLPSSSFFVLLPAPYFPSGMFLVLWPVLLNVLMASFVFSRLLNADALGRPLLSLAGPVLAYSSNCFHMQMATVCFNHIQILFLQLVSISVYLMAYNHLKFKYVCPKLDFSLPSPRGQPQTYSSFVHPSVSSIPASGMKPSCNSPSPTLAFTIPSQILLILLTRNGNWM